MKRSKAKTIACIAAICYILYGITILIDWVIPSFRRQEYLMAFMPIVFFGGLIGLAVAHMLGNKKAAVIAAGVTVLYWVYRLTIWFCAWNIFGFLAAVSLVLLFVFALKGNDIVKKLWFAPAVFMLAYHIINIIQIIQINEIIDFSYYFSVRLLLRVCFPLFVIIAGLILTGLWLKNGHLFTAPQSALPINLKLTKIYWIAAQLPKRNSKLKNPNFSNNSKTGEGLPSPV